MNAVMAGPWGRRYGLIALAVIVLAALVALAVAEPSWAASGVGKRLENEIETWAKAAFAVVGLVGVALVAKRDVAGGAVFAVLALVVGMFIFAPGQTQSIIKDVGRALGG